MGMSSHKGKQPLSLFVFYVSPHALLHLSLSVILSLFVSPFHFFLLGSVCFSECHSLFCPSCLICGWLTETVFLSFSIFTLFSVSLSLSPFSSFSFCLLTAHSFIRYLFFFPIFSHPVFSSIMNPRSHWLFWSSRDLCACNCHHFPNLSFPHAQPLIFSLTLLFSSLLPFPYGLPHALLPRDLTRGKQYCPHPQRDLSRFSLMPWWNCNVKSRLV